MTSFYCGIDIGGTFTDCVVIDEEGALSTCKVPSTPGNFGEGMLAALTRAADQRGLSVEAFCEKLVMLSHGTTVGTNAVIQKRGVRVGLITTKGHNDVIHIMRGSRGLTGRDLRLVVHIPESQKPDPIVPKRLVEGVSERVDCFGKIVSPLNEDEAAQAIERLIEKEVEAIAVCFLWSFLDPTHEQRIKAMIAERAPGMFVTCSHELVPKWGEYERTTAVALNAYIGPITTRYLAGIDREVKANGYRSALQITQCAGGTISVDKAMEAPLLTLDSGPVSGVVGSKYLADLIGQGNVITTDMGGTSFDVGLIHSGEPAFTYRSNVNQYEYFLPKVDIQTVGSGGGSKVWIDETTGTMRVGPESAGADPGPVCYGRGGTDATVTDADLVLGYLDPDNFAGGAMTLDKAAAEAAIDSVADRLGIERMACASGIAQIAEFQMADLVRKVTIQKGFDPRDFVLFAFGGAGPVHAGVFARELGVSTVVIPQRETASVWCAFGAASADVLHVYEQVRIMPTPFDADTLNTVLEDLAQKGEAQLRTDGIPEERWHLTFSLDMRHKGQVNEVEVPISGRRLDDRELEALREAFVNRYELLFGRGAALKGARLEVVTFRCRAGTEMPKPVLSSAETMVAEIPEDAQRPSREIYWAELSASRNSPIFDGHRLLAGNRIEGPAVVETVATSVIIHPGQSMHVDAYGNFVVDVGEIARA